jgi:hypothetical protein
MRREFDQYYSHEKQVRELLRHCPVFGKVFEPCVGEGVIKKVIEEQHGAEVFTADIDFRHNPDVVMDATDSDMWNYVNSDLWDWVVTNPPFSRGFEILQMALQHSRNVALLMRLSFLEPTFSRGEFLAKRPPTTIIVLPRHSFTGDGKSDSVTCAWFVWEDSPVETRIIICEKEKRK